MPPSAAVKRRAEVLDDYPVAALKPTELRAEEPVDSTLEPTELRASSSRPNRSRSPKRSDQVESHDLARLEEDSSSSLIDTWERNNVTGPGVEILKQKQERLALIAFLAEDRRLPTPLAEAYAKTVNEKKEARGKTLNYEKEDKETREFLDVSRRTEWEKWKKFVAGRPCSGEELKKLLEQGHVPIPTRWVDVDKAAHKRRIGGPIVPPEMKSRLCGRGDLEGIDGLRADSPTAEIESHNLLFSYAASNKLKIKTADISNAYFQGEVLDRLLLMRPPKGGIPDDDYADGETLILARVPIYGTQDAGRKFWQRFSTVIKENGFLPNKFAPAMYSLSADGDIKGILITHVDDLCWACKPGYEINIEKILETFAVRKVEECEFRFCGKEVKQYFGVKEHPDFTIVVTCKDTTETINPVRYETNGRKQTDYVTEAEQGQMRSVTGSLGWIARQCRPGLSYMVSKLQGAVSKAQVKDLKETNQALDMAKEHSGMGLTFKSDAISWTDCVLVTVTDASFANETIIEPSGREKPQRSQKAYMILFVHPDILKQNTAGCHIYGWRSTTDKRVCRATIQAEAHGMLSGEEMGTRTRAIIADCRGLVPDVRDWEAASSRTMRHLWLSDCESLVSHLKNPKNEKLENVRLSIDIQGLKQVLWHKPDGTEFDTLPAETVAENAVRWIDTSIMVVDCLTKKMSPEVVHRVQSLCELNLEATPESKTLKMRKQKQRAAKTKANDEANARLMPTYAS